jgi:hypothetical protein
MVFMCTISTPCLKNKWDVVNDGCDREATGYIGTSFTYLFYRRSVCSFQDCL